MTNTIKLPTQLPYNDLRDAEKLLPLATLMSALAYTVPHGDITIAWEPEHGGYWYAEEKRYFNAHKDGWTIRRYYAGDDCDNPPKEVPICYECDEYANPEKLNDGDWHPRPYESAVWMHELCLEAHADRAYR